MRTILIVLIVSLAVLATAGPAPYVWFPDGSTGYSTVRTVYHGGRGGGGSPVVETVEYVQQAPQLLGSFQQPAPFSTDAYTPIYSSAVPSSTLQRKRRQIGMGGGMAGAQAQAQSQSMGTGMGMGYPGFGGMMGGFPFMMPFMG